MDASPTKNTPVGELLPNKFTLTNIDTNVTSRPRRFMETEDSYTPVTKGRKTLWSALQVEPENVELFESPGGSIEIDAASTLGVMGKGRHLMGMLSPGETTLQLFYRLKNSPPQVVREDAMPAGPSNSSAAATAAGAGVIAAGGLNSSNDSRAKQADNNGTSNVSSSSKAGGVASIDGRQRKPKGPNPLGNPGDPSSDYNQLKKTLLTTMAWKSVGVMIRFAEDGFWQEGYDRVIETFCQARPHLDRIAVHKKAVEIIKNHSQIKEGASQKHTEGRQKTALDWEEKYGLAWDTKEMPHNDHLFGTDDQNKTKKMTVEKPQEGPQIMEPGMNQFLTMNPPELEAVGVLSTLGTMQVPQDARVLAAAAAAIAAGTQHNRVNGLTSTSPGVGPTSITGCAKTPIAPPSSSAASSGQPAISGGKRQFLQVQEDVYTYLDQLENGTIKLNKTKRSKQDKDAHAIPAPTGRQAKHPHAKKSKGAAIAQQSMSKTRSGRVVAPSITKGPPASTQTYYNRRSQQAAAAAAAATDMNRDESQQAQKSAPGASTTTTEAAMNQGAGDGTRPDSAAVSADMSVNPSTSTRSSIRAAFAAVRAAKAAAAAADAQKAAVAAVAAEGTMVTTPTAGAMGKPAMDAAAADKATAGGATQVRAAADYRPRIPESYIPASFVDPTQGNDDIPEQDAYNEGLDDGRAVDDINDEDSLNSNESGSDSDDDDGDFPSDVGGSETSDDDE